MHIFKLLKIEYRIFLCMPRLCVMIIKHFPITQLKMFIPSVVSHFRALTFGLPGIVIFVVYNNMFPIQNGMCPIYSLFMRTLKRIQVLWMNSIGDNCLKYILTMLYCI